MDKERFRQIVPRLSRYQLNFIEGTFVQLVKSYFKTNGSLTVQQESILEGLYLESIKCMGRQKRGRYR